MATANERGKTPEQVTEAFPRWVWLVGAGALLAVGWGFILMANNFRFTAPVVFVCLGYLAGVSAVYALFRTGASAATAGQDDDDGDDASWGRPIGARAELEREKKALLKAIKEAEFDLQMDKLSKADAEEMIGELRARALAVIRELDATDGDEASVREQIEREVRARIEVAKGAAGKKAADAGRSGKKGKKQQAEKARGAIEKADAAAEKTNGVAGAAEANAEVAAAEAAERPAADGAEAADDADGADAAADGAEAADDADEAEAAVAEAPASVAAEAPAAAGEVAAQATAESIDRTGAPAARTPDGAAAGAAKEAIS